MNKNHKMQMPTRPSDERMAKAPNWVKEYVENLERTARVAHDRYHSLMASQEVTRVAVGKVWDSPTYVPDDQGQQQVMIDVSPPARFKENRERENYSARDYVMLMTETERGGTDDDMLNIRVQAAGTVSIELSASNSFIIKMKK